MLRKIPLSRFISKRLLILLITGLSLCAHAQSPPLDFSLELSHSELDLQYQDTRYPLKSNRISVQIVDLNRHGLDTGLIIGSGNASLGNDSHSAGLRPGGPHLGLLLRRRWDQAWQLDLEARLLYQQLTDATAATEVKMDGFEWQLASSLRLGLGRAGWLRLAGAYADMDLERRVTGSTNHTLELSRHGHAEALVEVGIELEDQGRIYLGLSRGSREAASLGFARRY